MFQHLRQWLHLHQPLLNQHLHQPLLLLLRPLMLLLTLPRQLQPMHRKRLMLQKMRRKMLRKMPAWQKTLLKMQAKLPTLQRNKSLPHLKKPTFGSAFFSAELFVARHPPRLGSDQSVKTGQQQKVDDLPIRVLPHHFQVIDARITRARVNREEHHFGRQIVADRAIPFCLLNQVAK